VTSSRTSTGGRTSFELAGADECFSTRQILRALFGEIYEQRLRKTKEEADAVALNDLRG
jgi:hypothetical protein